MIKCIGKQQPSKQALDKFIQIYKEIVKINKESEKNGKVSQRN